MIEDLGKTIKEIRKDLGLTQAQLGNKVGMGKDRISKIERGDKNLTLNTLIKIVHALGYNLHINFEQ